MSADRSTIDSKIVDRALREGFWAPLKGLGFDRRTGRTAWRDRPACVQTVNVQSYNRYLADAIGSTTFSFGVNLGVYYPAIAEHSVYGQFVKDPARPAEYHCQARLHMAKGIAQPERWKAPDPGTEWKDRPDVWFVRPDGSNIEAVVDDALERVRTVGIAWLERLADPREARRAFLEAPSTNHAPGIVAETYGGALGSPLRRQAVDGLSFVLAERDGIRR